MGKTYSLRTCVKPLGVVSVPGEKGHSSIPYGEGVTALIWEDDGTPAPERNTLYYMKVWREVEAGTIDLINGKYGKLESIVIDGIHKLYQIGLAIATDGESARLHSAFQTKVNERGKEVLVGEFDPRCYGKAHNLIWEYVNMVASSKVPWRIFTSWSEMEKDDPDDTSRDAAKHMMPDLPGKAARRVLGEVSVTLHALIDPKGQYVWQTKPGGKVAGAGMKGEASVIAKVPQFIPQDFGAFAKYLCG
jgi:hypothetical protein